MTGYLLDTNVPSEFSRERPEPRVVQWLKAQPSKTLFSLRRGQEVRVASVAGWYGQDKEKSMGVRTRLVDRGQTLDVQQNDLNFIEQSNFVKVVNYAKHTGADAASPTSNEAALQDVPRSQPQPGPLHLIALALTAAASSIINSQMQAGNQVVFHDIGYVSVKEQIILGFRKP